MFIYTVGYTDVIYFRIHIGTAKLKIYQLPTKDFIQLISKPQHLICTRDENTRPPSEKLFR